MRKLIFRFSLIIVYLLGALVVAAVTGDWYVMIAPLLLTVLVFVPFLIFFELAYVFDAELNGEED